jgi:cholesterol oxidase
MGVLMPDFDVVVIGSGFGGAIAGCRLQEAGYQVLILERGRRWSYKSDHPDFYPRDIRDVKRWIWRDDDPATFHGWLDLRVFPNMTVAQGAAVGGGSQIYANVSVEAPASAFEDYPGLASWPAAIRKTTLQPYYDAVGKELGAVPIPRAQWSSRTALVEKAAFAIGQAPRFRTVPLAINFSKSLTIDHSSPNRPARDANSIRANRYGVPQGDCYHCGQCDIGCDVNARNTLDTNYIPRAEVKGAKVRSLHIVRFIECSGTGYRVHFDRFDGQEPGSGSVTAQLVIVAAGSLGSTELLLRCRDEFRTLPKISRRLGHQWTSNGDFLTPAIHADQRPLPNPSEGPPITAVIDFLDRSQSGQSFWVQDGGFPNLLGQYLQGPAKLRNWLLLAALGTQVDADSANLSLRQPGQFRSIMPWFAQAVDASDGVLSLKRRWWSPCGPRKLALRWDIRKSEAAIDAVVRMHKQLASATNGIPLVPPTWSIAKDLITPHPLGGCAMADEPSNGVVNQFGEVFGYANLYVVDGSIFPRAIGVNPSRTIGALAEWTAANIVTNHK